MTDDIDLWTGTHTDIDDNTWIAYTYEDDAVQFIHTNTHAEVWQDRTVVTEDAPTGRVEAHYSESTGYLYLVAATTHNRPPEHDDLYDADDLSFDPDTIDDETLELVLQTFLAEWSDQRSLAPPNYPGHDSLDSLVDLTNDATAAKDVPFGDRTTQEVFDAAVSTIAANAANS